MKRLYLVALLSTVLVFPISAGAAVVYDLNISNTLTPDLYGTATLTSVNGTTVSWDINLDESKLNPVGNYGIDKFFFNTNLSPYADSSYWSITEPAGWSVFSFNSGAAGFGTFSLQYKGTGDARVEPLQFTLQYLGTDGIPDTITEANFDVANTLGHHVLVHVGGIEVQGQGSAYLTDGLTDGPTPVPEPGTMMLLGSGLVGLAGWGRKKFRK